MANPAQTSGWQNTDMGYPSHGSLSSQLQSAGIPKQDADMIVAAGGAMHVGNIGVDTYAQPMNTGGAAISNTQPLNTGTAALGQQLASISQPPVVISASSPGWINWLILLVMAFIAIFIVVKVFK